MLVFCVNATIFTLNTHEYTVTSIGFILLLELINLTLKAPITTAANDKFATSFLIFEKK